MLNLSLPFFGEQGLTSTSANHIANLAKESYENLESYIERMRLYSSKIGLIGSNDTQLVSLGISYSEFLKLPSVIKRISDLKSLIAWLREAIKKKNSLMVELENASLKDFCQEQGIPLPESPEKADCLTEDEYYASLPVKARNQYYSLETQCAVIGKVIHKEGPLSIARKQLADKIQNPISTTGSGRDMTILSHTPTVQQEDADNMFFKLQKKHRELQASLNAMKAECEKAVKLSQTQVNTEYDVALAKYLCEKQEILAKFADYKRKAAQEIQSLKIVIPDALKETYEELNSLGRKQ